MSKIIGIDLGTTNSCVAVVEGASRSLFRIPKARVQPPRLSRFSKTGERLVGASAKRQAVTNPTKRIFDQTIHGTRPQ